jgi:hypothetical protein
MRSDPVLELARRGAVRLAVFGGAALSLASLIQILLGDSTGFVTMVAALPTTVLAIVMLRQDRPNVIVLASLIAAIALAAEIFAALNGHTQYVAGIGGEVVIFGLGILAVFVARERPVAVATGFLAASASIVVVAQLHLNGFTLEIASDIVVVVAVMGTLMYLVIRVMESLSLSRGRYADLANMTPVVVLELDVQGVVSRARELAVASGDSEEFLGAMMELVRMPYSNETANRLVEVFGTWDELVVGDNSAAIRSEGNRMLLGWPPAPLQGLARSLCKERTVPISTSFTNGRSGM